MSQISDEQLVTILARASREFSHVRQALLTEDEPTPEQIEEDVQAAVASGEVSADDAEQVSEQVSGDDDSDGTTQGQQRDGSGNGSDNGADDDTDDSRGLLGTVGAAAGTVGSAALSVARFGARQVTGKVHPRREDWGSASLDDRVDWWVDRFGTGVAALAAVPSFGGRLTRMAVSPLLNAVGAAGQVLVVNAVGHEVGTTDEADRVVAAADIVLGRTLDVDQVRAQLEGSDPGEPEALASEFGADTDEDDPPGILRRLGSSALLIRRVERQFRSMGDMLGERPQGGLIARLARNLPAVGVLGGFLAERGGVKQAAREARQAFEA